MIAQKRIRGDTTCSFLKNLIFKNGVDTIEVEAKFRNFVEGPDAPYLRILANKKKLQYSEYVDKYESCLLEFISISCDKSFAGTLSRKTYDKTFAKKIGREHIDFDKIKPGHMMFLKCIVFDEEKVRGSSGEYFFTIVDMRLL